MTKLIRCGVLALMLAPPSVAAQDYDAGLTAYESDDYATALREWTPLAEQGYADAQFNLALMYRNGDGVPQDDAEAAKWNRQAAEQAHASAQSNLGIMYATGEGVLQNVVTAHMWINIAAANGDEKATEARDIVASEMTSEAIVKAQKRAKICIESGYEDCE